MNVRTLGESFGATRAIGRFREHIEWLAGGVRDSKPIRRPGRILVGPRIEGQPGHPRARCRSPGRERRGRDRSHRVRAADVRRREAEREVAPRSLGDPPRRARWRWRQSPRRKQGSRLARCRNPRRPCRWSRPPRESARGRSSPRASRDRRPRHKVFH